MPLITWSDALSVNVREFDEQHKKLIAIVNELHSAMGSGKGKDVMGGILDRLLDYTKSHFSNEEYQMQRHGYAGYVAHKARHDALTRQVAEFAVKFKEGKAVVTVEVMNFLKDWLATHIQETDRQYGPFLNGKGVS